VIYEASVSGFLHSLEIVVLCIADRGWLEQLITRRVPPDRWRDALDKRPDDIKTIIEFTRTREVP
jgi:hypothetical protein